MALRNQPYLPLYVQDFLTDEKLMECSASATGVYIRILCIMHKSETYGKILLKQKDKQTDKQVKNFALKFAKQFPYPVAVIEDALEELLAENVLQLDGDFLSQKRMVNDNKISEIRALTGSKGGKKTQSFAKEFAKAKIKANTEYEYEYEYEYENENNNENEPDFFKPDIEGDLLVFPLDTQPVRELWASWKRYRWRKHNQRYAMMGEQADLKRLEGMSFSQIKQTILAAIAGNWKNLYPENVNANGKPKTTTKQQQSAATTDYLRKHYSEKLGKKGF